MLIFNNLINYQHYFLKNLWEGFEKQANWLIILGQIKTITDDDKKLLLIYEIN